MVLDSHRMVLVFIFFSWLDLLDVAPAFLTFILKIFKLLQKYFHRVTNIISFEKHLESSSCHTLSFCLNLLKYRFKNMFLKESLIRSSTVYKLRRVKCQIHFVSSGSKIIKRLRRRKYDQVIIERTIYLVLGPSTALYSSFLNHCTLTNKAVGLYTANFATYEIHMLYKTYEFHMKYIYNTYISENMCISYEFFVCISYKLFI